MDFESGFGREDDARRFTRSRRSSARRIVRLKFNRIIYAIYCQRLRESSVTRRFEVFLRRRMTSRQQGDSRRALKRSLGLLSLPSRNSSRIVSKVTAEKLPECTQLPWFAKIQTGCKRPKGSTKIEVSFVAIKRATVNRTREARYFHLRGLRDKSVLDVG